MLFPSKANIQDRAHGLLVGRDPVDNVWHVPSSVSKHSNMLRFINRKVINCNRVYKFGMV